MQSSICKCSCASEIRNIYGGLLQQWSLLNDAVNPGIVVLNSMCKADYVRSISATISESNSVQCASNNLNITIAVTSPNSFIPSGSVITLVGLNADDPLNGLQVKLSPPSLLQSFVWSKASCSPYCIPSRACPVSSSCNSSVTSQRPTQCSQWCDVDGVVQITVKESFQNTSILITVNNPCAGSRFAPAISIAVAGPKFFSPFLILKQPSTPVLMSSSPPIFGNFLVTEDQPDQYDPLTRIWRGSALGQVNTLLFSFTTNVDLFSGTNITISGLKYSLAQNLKSPSIRQSPALFTDLVVDLWSSDSGTISLRVSSKLEGPVIPAKQILSFGLEVTMPLTSGTALKTSPILTVGATGLGPRRACCCSVAQFVYPTQVLVPKSSSLPFFPTRRIGQSTCSPGECNTISLTIAVNTAVNSATDSFFLMVTGLNGMDLNSVCSASCNVANSIVSLQDITPGAGITTNCSPYFSFLRLNILMQVRTTKVYFKVPMGSTGRLCGIAHQDISR